MMYKMRLIIATTTGLCLLPAVAAAQDNNSAPQPISTAGFSLGYQWVGGSNTGLYGRYNGFTYNGSDFLAGFDLSRRYSPDSGYTAYYDITGDNLVVQAGSFLSTHFNDTNFRDQTNNNLGPESSLGIDFGEQGTFDVSTTYNAITYTGNTVDSIYNVNGSMGVLNFNLPPWAGATNVPPKTGTITAFTTKTLAPYLDQYQTGTRRNIFDIVGHYLFGDWTVTTAIRHEHKEGSLEQSLRETYSGIAFAMPVDYDTNRLDVSAAYNTPDLQAVLQYTYMSFKNDEAALALPYPNSIGTLTANSGPHAQSALFSQPTSNSAHYVTAMVGDNLAPATRIVLNGRFGVELQNSGFPANSANPNLSNTLGNPTFAWFNNLNGLNQGTTSNSLAAVAWIFQGNLAIDTNLAQGLDGRVSYSFDGRSVHVDQFKVWGGGVSPDATANSASYVVPQKWFNQTAKLEGTYKIWPENDTKVIADYAFNDVYRTNAQVEHSITNTGSIQLSSRIIPDVLSLLTYAHAERSGTLVYGRAWGNLISGAPEMFDTPSGAYYQAPMVSNSVTLRTNYAPEGKISGGIYVKFVGENFHYPSIPFTAPAGDWTLVGHGEGITRDYNLSVGPDINYRPIDDVNLHTYYTYERIFYNNIGNGACAESNTGACAGSAGYYANSYKNQMHSAGFNGTWQASDKLKLTADYNFAVGSVIFGEFNGVMVSNVTATYQNVSNYPDVNSVMHDVLVTARYQVLPNVEWAVFGGFSMFHNKDWDYTGIPILPTTNTGTAISVLTPGYGPPKYDVTRVGTVIKVAL